MAYVSSVSDTPLLPGCEVPTEGQTINAGAAKQKSTATQKKAQSSYGKEIPMQKGQQALRKALEALGGPGKGPITFARIAEYQKELQVEFTVKVRKDLVAKGVDLDTEFELQIAPDGKIVVSCDDGTAKQIIEQYVEDNPAIGEQMEYIQALANFERARQTKQGLNWSELQDTKAAIQAAAVEQFFSTTMNSSMGFASLLADFSPGGAVANFYTGVNYTV